MADLMNSAADNSQISDPNAPPPRPTEPYKFSPDELRVLQQCNVESFYQRCMPIGTLLGLGAFFGVKTGYLRGNAKFGAAPKVCLAVIAGYFIGKVSYQQKCAQKFMNLPNSQVGEMLRKRKRQGFTENLSLDPGFSAPIGIETSSLERQPMQSYLDMDSERRPYEGNFDRPNIEESYDLSSIPVAPAGTPPTTYDELRRRNREEYEGQRNKSSYNYKPSDEAPVVVRAPPSAPVYSPSKPKNKYGDEWE